MYLRNLYKNSNGFSMLELLWVIVIIGFLTAMVAPRLGGISQRSAEKINEANLKDIPKFIETYQSENNNNFPPNCINPVLAIAGGIGATPFDCIKADVEDRTNTSTESLSYDFDTRCNLLTHVLNLFEARELRAMGITKVLSLNNPDDFNYNVGATHDNRFASVDIANGVTVLMIGGRTTNSAGNIIPSTDFSFLGQTLNNPEWLYRIVVGIGPDSGIVTDEIIETAPLCPAGLKNSHYSYNYYSIVLPRLQTTILRFGAAIPFDDDDGDGYLDFDVIDASDTTNGQIKRIQLAPMDKTQIDIVDATGHGRQEDVDMWMLYDDNGTGL